MLAAAAIITITMNIITIAFVIAITMDYYIFGSSSCSRSMRRQLRRRSCSRRKIMILIMIIIMVIDNNSVFDFLCACTKNSGNEFCDFLWPIEYVLARELGCFFPP